MTRVSDYIISFIYKAGVSDIFMVAGGGAMFLNDAIAGHAKLNFICNHHEQASVMAAEAYARITGNLGVAVVTSGPGSTNAVTGVVGAWQDSTPCMIISGQSKRSQNVYNSGISNLRQFGFLEVNTVPIVKSITKYAVMVNKPEEIRFHLEKALYLAKSGRPGPVWLDIPLDVQGALIDEKKLKGFKAPKLDNGKRVNLSKSIKTVLKLTKSSKRPVIIAGNGIRLSGATAEFSKLVKLLGVPVVTAVMGTDAIEDDHANFIGKAGMRGERAANIAIQNSDLIISIGSRLSVSIIGYEYENFAPKAKKIVVDIDGDEHRKKTIKIDLLVVSDAKEFINMLSKSVNKTTFHFKSDWLQKCKELRNRFPIYIPEYSKASGAVNMYETVNQISKKLVEQDIVVTDAGYSYYVVRQALEIKKGQRLVLPAATGAMGFNLPASIGACVGSGRNRVICITGDGSLMTNIHELQVISFNELPIKIFVLNNRGYVSIRNTQSIYFKGRLIGESEKTGLSLPDTSKIARAFGIKYFKANNSRVLGETLPKILEFDGPVICEVNSSTTQQIMPTVTSKQLPDGTFVSASIDDMYPFIEESEMEKIRQDLS